MKKIILISSLSLFMNLAYCQEGISVKGGLNVSYSEGSSSDIAAKFGFHLGVGFNHEISDDLSYEQGFVYSQHGFTTGIDTAKTKYLVDYITFPFLMKIKISENISLLAGP